MKAISGGLWFAVLILLMHGLRDVYGPYLKRRVVKFFLAPGIVVFLFFKILSCYVAGARIKEIKPFDDGADLLHYEKPSLGAVGEFLIGSLPLACLLLCFILLFTYFPARGMQVPSLPLLPLLWKAPGTFAGNLWEFVRDYFTCSAKVCGQIRYWLLVYAAVNTLLAGAPPFKDLKYIVIAAALAVGAAAGMEWLNIKIGSKQAWTFFTRVVQSFGFLLGSGGALIVISVITVGTYRLFLSGDGKKK